MADFSQRLADVLPRVLLAGAGLLTLEMAACAPTPPPPMAADPAPVAATTPDRTLIHCKRGMRATDLFWAEIATKRKTAGH